jgi:hypothetical protein
MGPCRVFTYYKNIYCSINPSEDIENLGRNTLVFESDWDKLPHLRKVAKSLLHLQKTPIKERRFGRFFSTLSGLVLRFYMPYAPNW